MAQDLSTQDQQYVESILALTSVVETFKVSLVSTNSLSLVPVTSGTPCSPSLSLSPPPPRAT